MRDTIAETSIYRRVIGLLAACSLSAPMLGGCAAVAFIGSEAAIGGAMTAVGVAPKVNWDASPEDLAAIGMEGSTVGSPITSVYHGLIRASDANGLKVIAADDAAYSLRLRYPFSLIANNWGGEIYVQCVVDGYGTRVEFQDNGNDTPYRVAKIEARLMRDTVKLLQAPLH